MKQITKNLILITLIIVGIALLFTVLVFIKTIFTIDESETSTTATKIDQIAFYSSMIEPEWKYTLHLNKKIKSVDIIESTFFLNTTIIGNNVFFFGKLPKLIARIDTAKIKIIDVNGFVKHINITIKSLNIWVIFLWFIVTIPLLIAMIKIIDLKSNGE